MEFRHEHYVAIRNLIRNSGVSDARTINRANEGLEILKRQVASDHPEKRFCNCTYPNFGPAMVCKKCGKSKA